MRAEIERRDIEAQMDNRGAIDLSQPFGHVTVLEAVIYDDENECVDGAIETCVWLRNGRPVEPDPALGETPPWVLRIDRMRGTEVSGVEDLYAADVTLKDE